MFEAVREAILHATEEGHAKGWSGADLQAHIFVAAFNAAITIPTPVDEPEADDHE